ncbi:hypothetical protein [Roseisolibacter agri]|uniref:Carboxypeptidase regulatory-like domain-containing protein n=1 Tax=Roseisolibacter agri TaxID=2014610 RepID=A0AA37QJ54_9BACT|nr:hypothetical protein [Roseisolibacter agri]GLC27465.1 hypothetical protein rosag_39780 [Roseisolibacter agri]
MSARAARALGAAAIVGAALVAACDPCVGEVAGCRVESHVSYAGKVIDFTTGRAASGVSIVFRRTNGSALAGDSIVARTDASGRYELRGDAGDEGDVVGDLAVRPPGLPGYVVTGVHLTPSTVRGGGGLLPTYVTQPFVDYVGELVYRRLGVPLAYSNVRFVRTSGARLAGGDTAYTAAGPDGYFYLERTTLDAGEVVGDFTLTAPQFPRPYVVRGVRLPVRLTDRLPTFDRSFRVGATLEYVAEVRERGTNRPLVGATVEFRRTGGVLLSTPVFTAATDANGRVLLRPVPQTEAAGEAVGDLTVRGGGLAAPFVIRGVRLPVYDSDELRFLGVLGIGIQAVAAGELVYRGDRSPLADAQVTFTRTGGVAATPATVQTRSTSDGRFGLTLLADSTGDVIGDLTVSRGGPAAPVTFRGVRVRASADDSVRFLGRFGVGQQLSYAGQLVQRATGAAAAGWSVSFRRTGGIALRADTFTVRTLDWGGFALSPDTREEGTVEGVLTARAPGDTRDVPIGSVRLSTFDADSVRFAGQFRVGPSLLYVGEVQASDGSPVVGARIEFRRTGGIAVAESLLVETSNAAGRFRLAPTPLASGEVIGDLRIVPPAPLRDTVFTGVRLPTFETDEVRLRDVWRLAPPR